MQKFCTKLPIITGMFLLMGSVGFCSLPAQENKEQTNLENVRFVPAEELRQNLSLSIHPWEDIVISIGLEKMNEPRRDVSTLTRLERRIALHSGLEILAAQSESEEWTALSSEVLAEYFFEKKEYKKAVYWMLKGAENGSSPCMGLLSFCYKTGVGVVQDFEEGVKWTYLAAATGDSSSLDWLDKHGKEILRDDYFASLLKICKERADQWVKDHPNGFISAKL